MNLASTGVRSSPPTGKPTPVRFEPRLSSATRRKGHQVRAKAQGGSPQLGRVLLAIILAGAGGLHQRGGAQEDHYGSAEQSQAFAFEALTGQGRAGLLSRVEPGDGCGRGSIITSMASPPPPAPGEWQPLKSGVRRKLRRNARKALALSRASRGVVQTKMTSSSWPRRTCGYDLIEIFGGTSIRQLGLGALCWNWCVCGRPPSQRQCTWSDFLLECWLAVAFVKAVLLSPAVSSPVGALVPRDEAGEDLAWMEAVKPELVAHSDWVQESSPFGSLGWRLVPFMWTWMTMLAYFVDRSSISAKFWLRCCEWLWPRRAGQQCRFVSRVRAARANWKHRFRAVERLRRRPSVLAWSDWIGAVVSSWGSLSSSGLFGGHRQVGLNHAFRGGGKKGQGSQKEEVALLAALGQLLDQFKSKRSGGSSDSVLLGALDRLVQRAKQNPVGLLERLENIVQLARKGSLKDPGPKEVEGKAKAPAPPLHSTEKKNEVGGGKAPAGAPKNPAHKAVPVRLEPSCWQGRLVMWRSVTDAIEKGVAPSGQVCLAPSCAKVEELVQLAKAPKCLFSLLVVSC